jgi:hypothetical protein
LSLPSFVGLRSDQFSFDLGSAAAVGVQLRRFSEARAVSRPREAMQERAREALVTPAGSARFTSSAGSELDIPFEGTAISG